MFLRISLFFAFFLLPLFSEPDELFVVPPKGWQKAKDEGLPKRVKLMLIGEGKGFFPPSLNLGVEPYPGTAKDYLSMMKQVNNSLGDKMLILGELTSPAGSGPLVQIDTRNCYGEIRLLQFILVRERIVFVLTAASLRNESGPLYSTFLETAKKLKFAPSLYDLLPLEEQSELRKKTEALYKSGEEGLPTFRDWAEERYFAMPAEWRQRLLLHVKDVLSYQYE